MRHRGNLNFISFFAALVAALLFHAAPAHAVNNVDCVNPYAPAGAIFYNSAYNVPQYCNGEEWIAFGAIDPAAGPGNCSGPDGPEGEVVFNTTYKVLQYCNGTDWRIVGSAKFPTQISPKGCPIPGDECTDGTVYAGDDPTNSWHIYVTRCDAGMSWDGSTCTGTRSTHTWNDGNTDYTDTSLANCGSVAACDPDGQANTAALITEDSNSVLAGQQLHAAAQYCADLNADGYADWYLPSAPELDVMYQNRVAIDKFDLAGSFYVASSEKDSTRMWLQQFSTGTQNGSTGKNWTNGVVRCARRETIDPCEGIGPGSEGTVCADGTVYAGESPTGYSMFTTRCDAGMNWGGASCINSRLTMSWNNGQTDYVDTSLVNCTSTPACDKDGEVNTAVLVTEDSDSNDPDVQPHAAAQYCADLVSGGNSDWYLPSAPELDVLYQNEVSIGEFQTTGLYYWSSSEHSSGGGRVQRFNDGFQGADSKNLASYIVRCVRR